MKPSKLIVRVIYFGLFCCIGVALSHETDLRSCRSFHPRLAEGFGGRSYHDTHYCSRPCLENEPSKVCYYHFVLEHYTTLGLACQSCPTNVSHCSLPGCVAANGIEKMILTVNRMFPGPSIQICKGDRIVVDVENQMPGRTTTIHWHGINQEESPFMDGVPMVTQCPILESQTFRYDFVPSTQGTYFWHSHDGLQKQDGIVGSLIVRQPTSFEPNAKLYDKDLSEHYVLITDWMNTTSDERLPGYATKDIGQGPNSYLINGKGLKNYAMSDNSEMQFTKSTPLTVYEVEPGYSYLFRFIAGTCLSCGFKVKIEGHQMIVISTGTDSLKPVVVDSMDMSSAQRFEVVINANKPPGDYWMMITGLDSCSHVKQVAVLRYVSYGNGTASQRRLVTQDGELLSNGPLNPPFDLPGNPGVVLNPNNEDCKGTFPPGMERICYNQLLSNYPTPKRLLRRKPDVRLIMVVDFHLFSLKEQFYSGQYNRFFIPAPGLMFSATINNITYKRPPSPLLTQSHNIPPHLFCDDLMPQSHEECLHVIRVPLDCVVELVMIDGTRNNNSRLSHPMHLHGFHMHVIDLGKLPQKSLHEQILWLTDKLDQKSKICNFCPKTDTLSIPAHGYTVSRIITNNPGFWLLHCHFLYHHEVGMLLTLNVGDLEDLPKTPPGFPTCGGFVPRVPEY